MGRISVTEGAKINWNAFIAAHGGVIQPPAVRDFGQPLEELAAARDSAALTPLSHFGVIAVTGPDASGFLQSQLTSDVRNLLSGRAQFSGYCNPKGRLIATFLIVRHADGYLLIVPVPLVGSLLTRLQKYLLRAKARLEDASDRFFLLGVTGPEGVALTGAASGAGPQGVWSVAEMPYGSRVVLPGRSLLLIARAERLETLWSTLSAGCRPAGAGAWDWSQIQGRLPWVLPATQELFLPQALGLEQHGAVSFEKGCYPGQEIVARTHYRGELKRHLAYGRAQQPVLAGQTIVTAGGAEPVGTIVNAAPSPAGGWELLAVVQHAALDRSDLQASDGTVKLVAWAASEPFVRTS